MEFKTVLSPAYLARILGLKLRAKAVLEGASAGWHRSPFHGYSSEFSQYKGYGPGEDLKHLDWKVYARQDHLVVKQFRDETNAYLYMVLDTSASMGYSSGAMNKLEYASVLAASLTLLADRQRDAVSLAHGNMSIREFLPPESGPLRTGVILKRLETLQPEGQTDLGALFTAMAPRIQGQSFVYLFTDTWQPLQPLFAGLRKIRHKTRMATLVQLRSPEENDFFPEGRYHLRDLESKTTLAVDAAQILTSYRTAVKAHEAEIARECSRLGVRLVSVNIQWPCDVALRKILF